MLYQTSQSVPFRAVFTASKQGKTGLTVTVDVWRDSTEIVTAGSATEIGDGIYSYTLSSGSTGTAGFYVAVFKTTDSTVDFQHVYSAEIVGNSLAAGIPSVAPGTSGGLPTVDSNNSVKLQSGTGANQISLTSGAVTTGTNNDKAGYSLTQAFPTHFSTLSIDTNGYVVASSIQGNVTGDVVGNVRGGIEGGGVFTMVAPGVIGLLDSSGGDSVVNTITTNLDAKVSSRLAASAYTAPDNTDIQTSLNDLVTLLGRTDPTTAINAIKAVTDKLQTMLATSGPNYTYTADSLKNAPTGSGGSSGTGAFVVTIHVTDGTNPIIGAVARMTIGGSSYTATSDGSGNASFSLDAGSYTLSVAATGYQYVPSTQTISNSTTIDITMNAVSGPSVSGSPSTVEATVFEPVDASHSLVIGNSGLILLARICTNAGTYAQQADVNSITWNAYDLEAGTQIGNTTTVSVASTVFNSLQLDGRWQSDTTGYNIAIPVSGSVLPSDSEVQIEAKVTLAAGNPVIVPFICQTTQVFTT